MQDVKTQLKEVKH